jgi:hypothetical protein
MAAVFVFRLAEKNLETQMAQRTSPSTQRKAFHRKGREGNAKKQ